MALVVALGKPAELITFRDLGDAFVRTVLRLGRSFQRTDVTFDQYKMQSTKSETRKKRSTHSRPIRRVITDGSVPLPNNWPDFLSLPENKSDLTGFLSHHHLDNAPADKTLIVSGGFAREDEVRASYPCMNTHLLQAVHEEAETRIILHCLHTTAHSVVVSAHDRCTGLADCAF